MTAEEVAARLAKPRRSGDGWSACCPAHDDADPSLSISDGDKGVIIYCHAGCPQDAVIAALRAKDIDITRKLNGTSHHYESSFNVSALAAAKKLPEPFLADCHVHDDGGRVAFEYITEEGERFRTKYRAALSGNRGFSMSKGEGLIPYGLWRLDQMLANDGRVILCEGETDALTLWHHGFTALGIPGSTQWRDDWAGYLPQGQKIYVIVEPDEGGRKFEEAFRKSKLATSVWFVHMDEPFKDPSVLHCEWPEAFVDKFEELLEDAEPAVEPPKLPMQWKDLAGKEPPARIWAIDQWFGMGHVTLMAGAGGLGKTSIAQAMSSCVAMGRDYLNDVPSARKVLMWACEDDEDELWRRQVAIAAALNIPLADFASVFQLMSYDGDDVELCHLYEGRVSYSPMLKTLAEQIGDYHAEAVVLDNIARLYGANENDRHQVTSFVSMLTKAAKPTRAGIMLLGHPAKGPGSEYSGSTAWEGAVRARLYLGRALPDQEQPAESQQDDGVRYLCRRKANYSTRDFRRIRYVDGVMIPDEAARPVTARPTEFAQDVVIRAVMSLERLGKHGNASTASPDYLPKLAHAYGLTEDIGSKQFVSAMRELEKAGKLKLEVVGQYQNRTPKKGLRVVS